MPKKKPSINYTNRDFNSIRADLETYVRRYYPDNYRDFTEASFGSLMLDTVAYIGDMLSFYTDYQANESFLDTAIEYDNVLKLSKELGYIYKPNPASYGLCNFFVTIPVESGGTAPNEAYMPLLKKGSTFYAGDNLFTLVEDVNFAHTDNAIVVAEVAEQGGAPQTYAIRASGQVVSGELAVQEVSVGSYTPFFRVGVAGQNITEIVSIFDDKGNQYYEVDYLSQDIIYVSVLNRGANTDTVPYILKPVSVSRRYRVEQTPDGLFIQFGQGSEENPVELKDPSEVVLKLHAKNYVSDTSFDPSILNQTDKLGVSPSNTVLTIIYRVNSDENVNTGAETITTVGTAELQFPMQEDLDDDAMQEVRDSLSVLNEDPIIGDTGLMTIEELKERASGNFAAQYRAVTKQDYISMAYNMPSKYGSFKKVAIELDTNSYNQRNLNYYVASEDSDGKLITSNATLKSNLKTWINQYKMINDTIDILDAKICNLGIEYVVVPFPGTNKYDLIVDCNSALRAAFDRSFDIGEPLVVTDVYQVLKSVTNLLDVVDVEIVTKTGALYADSPIFISEALSADGRFVVPPSNTVFEIKYPELDIGGTVQ